MDNKELKKKELQERINVRYGRRRICGTHLAFLKEFSKWRKKQHYEATETRLTKSRRTKTTAIS